MAHRTPTPHDIFFQTMMEVVKVAASFFQNHLPAEAIEALNWSTLQIADSARRTPYKKTTYTDITYVCYTKEEETPIYLHVEQERNIDPAIVERILRYKVGLFTKCRKQKQKKLPVIFTFVLFNGNKRKKYPYHLDQYEYFSIPWMAKLAMDSFFGLINLNEVSKDELLCQGAGGILELLLKSVDERNFVLWLKQEKKQIQNLITQEVLSEEIISMIIDYVLQVGQETPEEVLEAFAVIYPTFKNNIMTTAKQLEKRGIEYGIQQGIQQGMQQGMRLNSLAIAQNMLQEGFDLSLVQKVTELSKAEIEQLKTQKLAK